MPACDVSALTKRDVIPMLVLPHLAPPYVVTVRRVLAALLASARLVANAASVPSGTAPGALEPPAVCVSSQGPAATEPSAVANLTVTTSSQGAARTTVKVNAGSPRFTAS